MSCGLLFSAFPVLTYLRQRNMRRLSCIRRQAGFTHSRRLGAHVSCSESAQVLAAEAKGDCGKASYVKLRMLQMETSGVLIGF
jgi:hypothetical protein